MAISLIINGKEAALKKGATIEYVSENRIFTDADDYSMEIELLLMVARPLIEALDYAQRTNTIGSLRNADVSRTITASAVLAQ